MWQNEIRILRPSAFAMLLFLFSRGNFCRQVESWWINALLQLVVKVFYILRENDFFYSDSTVSGVFTYWIIQILLQTSVVSVFWGCLDTCFSMSLIFELSSDSLVIISFILTYNDHSLYILICCKILYFATLQNKWLIVRTKCKDFFP